MVAEIIEINKPLQDDDGDFKAFIDEIYNNALEVVMVAKTEDSYLVFSSVEDKITQIKMLYRLKRTLDVIVESYPDEEDFVPPTEEA